MSESEWIMQNFLWDRIETVILLPRVFSMIFFAGSLLIRGLYHVRFLYRNTFLSYFSGTSVIATIIICTLLDVVRSRPFRTYPYTDKISTIIMLFDWAKQPDRGRNTITHRPIWLTEARELCIGRNN